MKLVFLVPLLPLAGFLVNGLAGHHYPHAWAHRVALAGAGGSLLLALGTFVPVALGATLNWDVYTWVAAGDLRITMGVQLDALSAVMMLVVTFVGFLIHVYSIGYMQGDPGYPRFFAYLNLFLFFMLTLVLANNYLLLFLGWEGVGLCSYLLIGFWYERRSATTAGNKAFIVNRVGDAGFLLGLFLIAATFGSLQYSEVFRRAPEVLAPGSAVATAIGLLLFLGATGKSAQLPLYVWLPDAMEGPTPVSALIHAATMVTAGVYMVARSGPLFNLAPLGLAAVAWVGGLTAFLGATVALVQTDIKRVIAYSTISQLGYMFLGLGVGAYASAIFHLVSQAFFKALLFLAAGSVIHGLEGEQDLRKMGGLLTHMRLTGYTFLVGVAANAGIFPFNGFWSKEEILAAVFAGGRYGLWALGVLTAFFSAAYAFRCYFLAFAGVRRGTHQPHESPRVMTVPLVVLATFTGILGFIGIPPEGGLIHRLLGPVLHTAGGGARGAEGAGLALAFLSLAVALGGVGVAWLCYVRRPDLPEKIAASLRPGYALLWRRYYLDDVYAAVFVEGSKRVGRACHLLDERVVDGAVNGAAAGTVRISGGAHWNDSRVVDGLANAVAASIGLLSGSVRKVQTGSVQNYLLAMAYGVLGILIVFLLLGGA